jgi:patatin-like phospholipase/acyl hydrolase
MARRYLLSIDGGGIRGIIPAVALAKLEATTGRPARETFSFAAGTSTGAIIAAAIAAGIPATRIVALYVDRAPEVFAGSPLLNTLQRIFTGSMYSTQKLRDVIAEELGPEAHGWSLNDSPIDLLITAKGVPDGKPWYFVRDNPANSGCTGRLGLADCVTGSAAAPTYFQPWMIEEPPGRPPRCDRLGAVIDGGVGVAGNPVYQACVEAFYYTDDANEYQVGETTTVSMGTGRSIVPKRRPTWIWSWLQWSLGELLESPGEQQTEIAWRHFVEDQPEDQKMTFYRIDTELKEDIALDDVGSIGRLREYGERLAERIDWEEILDGTDEQFRVRGDRTSFRQYAKETI